ncbi:low temperature requirement protein A [Candidatus Mycoplasma pogonae]
MLEKIKKVKFFEHFYDIVFILAMVLIGEGIFEQLESKHFTPSFYVVIFFTFALLISLWFYQTIFINKYSENKYIENFFLFINMYIMVFLALSFHSVFGGHDENKTVENQNILNLYVGILCIVTALEYLTVVLINRKTMFKNRKTFAYVLMAVLVTVGIIFISYKAGTYHGESLRHGLFFALVFVMVVIPVTTMFICFKNDSIQFHHVVERFIILSVASFGESLMMFSEKIVHGSSIFEQMGRLSSFFFVMILVFAIYIMQLEKTVDSNIKTSGAMIIISHFFIYSSIIALPNALLVWKENNLVAIITLIISLTGFLFGTALNTIYKKEKHKFSIHFIASVWLIEILMCVILGVFYQNEIVMWIVTPLGLAIIAALQWSKIHEDQVIRFFSKKQA